MRRREGYMNGTMRARAIGKERVKPANTVDIPMLNNEPEIHANWQQPLGGGAAIHAGKCPLWCSNQDHLPSPSVTNGVKNLRLSIRFTHRR